MGKFRSRETTIGKVIVDVILAIIPIMLFVLLVLFLMRVHNEAFVDQYIIFNCNWGNLMQIIKGTALIILIINVLALMNKTVIGRGIHEKH